MKNNSYHKKSFFSNVAGFFAFFYYWLGPVSVIAYLYAIFKTKFTFPLKFWVALCGLFFISILSCIKIGLIDSLFLFRFHWGFLIFYLYFRGRAHLYNVRQLFILMLILVVIEIIAVNFFISAAILPNYPSIVDSPSHFSDVWQRTYSFGGNSSVTSSLIIAVISMVNPGTLMVILTGVVIIAIGGGSGMFAWIGYVIFRFRKRRGFFINSLIFLSLWFLFASNFEFLYKVSPGYLSYLIELKISQISIAFNNMQVVDFLFGSGYIKGGDFVWLHFFRAHGLFGAFVMALLILTNINKKNAFGVLIIVLMTGHYFVLFSLPGQLITGYLLATNEINKN